MNHRKRELAVFLLSGLYLFYLVVTQSYHDLAKWLSQYLYFFLFYFLTNGRMRGK